jgi:hypothetical protein
VCVDFGPAVHTNTRVLFDRSKVLASRVILAVVAISGVTNPLARRREIAGYRAHVGEGFIDEVSRFHQGLDGLRARLAGRAEVYYVTNVPSEEIGRLDKPEHTVRLFIAQYALAPTVLRWRHPLRPASSPERRRTLVLANFPTATSLDTYLALHPHELRWRRGGLALLRLR